MDRKKNLETSLVIVTGLLVIYLINNWVPLLKIAAIIGLIGIFFDILASRITWLWFKLADILGLIVPKIILSLIFFFFLFPISLLYRLSNKAVLRTKRPETMWIQREKTYSEKDILNPW